MGRFSEYPFTNYNDLNLDWIIKNLKYTNEKLAEYLENAVIHFGDPIQWNITSQYTMNTMVIDSDGTAYLAKQPVPVGIDITNTLYWQPIFNYDDNINLIRANIATNTGTRGIVPAHLNKKSLVWFNGNIYITTTDLEAGAQLIVGTNCEKTTVEQFIDLVNKKLANEIIERHNADSALSNAITENVETAKNEINERINNVITGNEKVTELKYTTPTVYNSFFKSIKMTDEANNEFDVLVASENLDKLASDKIYKTVSEMKADTNIQNGDIVKSLGYYNEGDLGGAYYIVGSTGSVNNLDIIALNNGLIATLVYERNMYPEQFGAHGNDRVDDYAALQRAIVMLPDEGVLLLTHDYFITAGLTTVGRNGKSFKIASAARSNYTPSIHSENQITILTASVPGLNINNIKFLGNEAHTTNGVVYDYDNNTFNGNCDSQLFNVQFSNFDTAIEVKGRNLKVYDCQIGGSKVGIKISQTSITTELRGYVITNNRFHYCERCVQNVITNVNNGAMTAIIKNNYADFLYTFYAGTVDDVTISENVIRTPLSQSTELISGYLRGVTRSAVITNNVFGGSDQPSGHTNTTVPISITVRAAGVLVIDDNTFTDFTRQYIHVLTDNGSPSLRLLSICNNKVYDIAGNATSARVIYVTVPANGSVSNNTITSIGNKDSAISVVTSNVTQVNNVIINNVRN